MPHPCQLDKTKKIGSSELSCKKRLTYDKSEKANRSAETILHVPAAAIKVPFDQLQLTTKFSLF
jgi:hypothetical protein